MFEGCPHVEPTEDRLRAVMAEEGVEEEIERVVVTEATVQSERFLGSPTVQIGGADIEPAARSASNFSFSCRNYVVDDHLSGVPPVEMIRAALRSSASTAPSPSPDKPI